MVVHLCTMIVAIMAISGGGVLSVDISKQHDGDLSMDVERYLPKNCWQVQLGSKILPISHIGDFKYTGSIQACRQKCEQTAGCCSASFRSASGKDCWLHRYGPVMGNVANYAAITNVCNPCNQGTCNPVDLWIDSEDPPYSTDRFPARRVLTWKWETLKRVKNPVREYWLLPNRVQNRGFILDIGSSKIMSQIKLVNTHNIWGNDRGTKNFHVDISADKAEWTRIVTGQLKNVWRQNEPRPETFQLAKPTAGQYLRFTAASYYGSGAGLQYFEACEYTGEGCHNEAFCAHIKSESCGTELISTQCPELCGKCPDGWSDYGEWSEWSDCPVTCGTAVQLRERVRTCKFGNGKCKGSPIDNGARACGTALCQDTTKTPMFDCYRNEKYSARGSVVVYNGCEVDTTAGAMDISSGIFTVQEAGTYQITFTAKFNKKVVIDLLVNDQVIADSQEDDAKASTHTIFVEHPLKKSDKVKVVFTNISAKGSFLHSDNDRDIHFTALKVGPLH